MKKILLNKITNKKQEYINNFKGRKFNKINLLILGS